MNGEKKKNRTVTGVSGPSCGEAKVNRKKRKKKKGNVYTRISGFLIWGGKIEWTKQRPHHTVSGVSGFSCGEAEVNAKKKGKPSYCNRSFRMVKRRTIILLHKFSYDEAKMNGGKKRKTIILLQKFQFCRVVRQK